MRGEGIYELLPVALQEAAVSLKGWQFHKVRYLSKSFKETAPKLKKNEQMCLEDLRDLQFEEFRIFAKHCYDNSPYYNSVWKSQKLHPEDIRHPEDISLIPIMPKQDLRARTEEFYTQKPLRSLTAVHTSGTTGSPLTVYFSNEDMGRRYAFLERCRRWAGIRIGQRRVSFTGRNIIPQRQDGPPFWRYNRPGRQLLFSSYHLSVHNLPAYVQALEKFQPEIIDGYPSSIHIVANHLLRNGKKGRIKPHAIIVTAETVMEQQRQSIEAAFGAKLYNQYSSSEGAPFISECSNGRLHVQLDSGLIEVIDSDGNPAKPGQIGQMVMTSFTTSVVPLLRYAIGDTAILSIEDGQSCPCGLPFPTVDAIVGRVDDFLYTPDRGFVGRMDTVFKSVPNSIVEAQIVQTSPDTVFLRIVPDRSSYIPGHADKIVEEMQRRLGRVIEIRVEEVDSIPRTANGKMRPVVNLCGNLLPNSFRYGGQ